MSQEIKQTQSQNLKQIQRLILSPQMQQALNLLQLPVCELSSIISDEMMQNPILEYVEEERESEEKELEIFKQIDEEFHAAVGGGRRQQKGRDEEDLRSFIESSISYEKSLFDLLIEQAHDTFATEEEMNLAEVIIGNIDPQGFLATSVEEIALLSSTSIERLMSILREIQNFDPPGVGARDLKESLLLQLQRQQKQESLSYKIVFHHFEDMLNNRLPLIAKSLSVTAHEVRHVVSSEIARLDLHPGTSQPYGHYKQIIQYITPDVIISYADKFTIEVNEESLPPLRINRIYLKMLEDPSLPSETRDYIREKIASGKWLLRNLCERHHTLYRIAEQLAELQKDFFSHPAGKLKPLTMKMISEKLNLHESTIARAVANKYISSPRGIYPFRFFFTHAYVTHSGEVLSSKTVKDLLVEIIEKENRRSPLSDEAISHMIKEQGIPCARRTVAKYRQELGIGNTSQRRHY